MRPFVAGGPLTESDNLVYIEREADKRALLHLREMDYIMLIEPRQQGKTSLIGSLSRNLFLKNYRFLYIDYASFKNIKSESEWYRDIGEHMREGLQSPPECEDTLMISDGRSWRKFLKHLSLLAQKKDERIVVVLDELTSISFPWSESFFSILREVYNVRAFAEPEFRHLTFILSGVYNPHDLIRSNHQSPFNIAHRVFLKDFDKTQTLQLVDASEWQNTINEELAERIHHWTDGQPYLTQLICSYLSDNPSAPDVDLAVNKVLHEDENHLPPLLNRLSNNNDFPKFLERVLAGEKIEFFPRQLPLHTQSELLGIIKADNEQHCVIRNRIYKLILHNSSIANEWLFPSLLKNPEKELLQYLIRLRDYLDIYFNEEDLKNLCFELGIQYDNLPAQGKINKTRELVEFMKRTSRLDELEETCQNMRPNAQWHLLRSLPQ